MPDRRVAPTLRHTLNFELPEHEQFVQQDELAGWFVRSDNQPVLRLEVIFSAGKIQESKEAVSTFTAAMLEKGTLSRKAEEISRILDQYSAHLEISPGLDFTTIGLYCLTRNLNEVLPLFLEIISEPSFDEEEFRIYREMFLQNLEINREKNSYLAGQAIRGLIFGKHPYGTTVNKSDVEALTTGDLKVFFKNHYAPHSVFAAGSISDLQLRMFSDGLKTGRTITHELQPPVYTPGEGRIEKKDSVQSSIRMGKPCISRTDSDYPAFLLANHILGGYFGSRLMKNIREEKGLTYGIYSGVQHMQLASMLTIGADVNKENLDAAISAIHSELNALVNIDADELNTARNHFIGSLQNDVNTIFAATDKIRTLYLNNLPADYYHDLILKLDGMSLEDIKKAAEKYFRPQDFSVAIAG
ncbi:MAG: M16 family metallopeptidase [Cyclobacteriaceae bacterium]